MNGNGAIKKPTFVPQGRADQQNRVEVLAGRDDGLDGCFNGVKQDILAEQIVDGIARDAQLRKHHKGHMLAVALTSELQDRGSVELGIGDLALRRAGGAANETMAVRRVKLHALSFEQQYKPECRGETSDGTNSSRNPTLPAKLSCPYARGNPMPYLIEILLPVTETFERRTLETMRAELTDMFGGVTIHANAPAEGLWKEGGDTERRDRIVVVEVMTEEVDRSWWADYRKRLEKQLSQEEIVVRSTHFHRL